MKSRGRRPILRTTGRLREAIVSINSSFWFIPSLCLIAALALGVALVEMDAAMDAAALAARWPRLLGAGAEGARGTLAAIATSMITVAGVVFSVTVVALSLAAGAYSPRVLRTFMRDRPTQTAFGVFVGIFAYCLVVLRTIRAPDTGDPFVPSLAVLVALMLALAGIWTLVYFIHHLAVAIQVSTIVERIADETRTAIDRVFVGDFESKEAQRNSVELEPDGPSWRLVPARRTGYLVGLDVGELIDFASRRGAPLRVRLAVGEFAIESQALVAVAGEVGDPAAAAREVDALFAVSAERTIEQDPGFGIQQIVDIAARALSPGVNNPSTAALCLDYLCALFVRLACRQNPQRVCGGNGEPFVFLKVPTFESLAALAFEPLARYAEGKDDILAHLDRVVRDIEAASPAQRRPIMLRYVDALARGRTRAQRAQ
jgi:uncharacterized membrane protein